jgi:predicted nucleotidyltransferase
MNKEQVLAKLREHEPELKASGIVSLALFGSVARGERGNDVDLMADFDAAKSLTLFDMVRLERRLAEIVGMPVDLASTKMLKERVKRRASRESVLAF